MQVVKERIRAEIESEPSTRLCQITVECSGGIISLNGSVGSYYQKQMVQEAARRAINKKIPYLALTVQNDVLVVYGKNSA